MIDMCEGMMTLISSVGGWRVEGVATTPRNTFRSTCGLFDFFSKTALQEKPLSVKQTFQFNEPTRALSLFSKAGDEKLSPSQNVVQKSKEKTGHLPLCKLDRIKLLLYM